MNLSTNGLKSRQTNALLSALLSGLLLFLPAGHASAANACFDLFKVVESASPVAARPLDVEWTPYKRSTTTEIPEVLQDPYAQIAFRSESFREWLVERAEQGDAKITDFKQLVDAKPIYPYGSKPSPPLAANGRVLRPNELSHQELQNYLLRNYQLAGASSVMKARFGKNEWREHHPSLEQFGGANLVSRALQKIHTTWQDLLRQAPRADRSTLLSVPNKYVVAGGRFRESYYWDSFWIMKGLISSGYGQTARGMLENLVVLYERHGIIPNGNRFYYLTRSQLPVFMEMVILLEKNGLLKFEPGKTNTRTLEARVLRVAKDYYQTIWKGSSRYNERFGLFKYSDGAGGHANANKVVIRPEAGILEPRAKERHSQRVFAESGWDMSYSRFGTKPQDWLPVDLNFVLMGYTSQLSSLLAKAGHHDQAKYFAAESVKIRENADRFLLDRTSGLYLDYNFAQRQISTTVTAASFFPFYVGAYAKGPEAQNALRYLYRTLKPDGDLALHTTNKKGPGQWDGDWSWAPLNETGFQALKRYEMDVEARELAFDYSLMAVTSFYRNGETYYEKYQARDGSTRLPKDTEIYGNEEGFGWTNATVDVFLHEVSRNGDLPRLEREVSARLNH